MLFAEDLKRVTWRRVQFVPSETEFVPRDALERDGMQVFEIDGATIRAQDQLFSALAKELKFPGYFGMSWDAVDECLRDMSWLPGTGYVLLVHNAEQLWKQSTRLAGAFVEAWLFAAEEWSQRRVPFHLVFVW